MYSSPYETQPKFAIKFGLILSEVERHNELKFTSLMVGRSSPQPGQPASCGIYPAVKLFSFYLWVRRKPVSEDLGLG